MHFSRIPLSPTGRRPPCVKSAPWVPAQAAPILPTPRLVLPSCPHPCLGLRAAVQWSPCSPPSAGVPGLPTRTACPEFVPCPVWPRSSGPYGNRDLRTHPAWAHLSSVTVRFLPAQARTTVCPVYPRLELEGLFHGALPPPLPQPRLALLSLTFRGCLPGREFLTHRDGLDDQTRALLHRGGERSLPMCLEEQDLSWGQKFKGVYSFNWYVLTTICHALS